MGSSKGSSGSSTTTQSFSSQPVRTKEQKELDKLQLEREKFLDPNIRSTQQSGLQLAEQLSRGGTLPGFLQPLAAGISPDVTNSIVQQSIKDLQPTFAKSGLLNSGVNAAISARTAADIRNQAEQFNLSNLLNLAQLGLGGQAQVQQPIVGFSNALSSRLAAAIGSTGTSTSQSQSFAPKQGLFGTGIPFPSFSIGPFGFGR